jgi:hypothetical protein
MLAAASPASSRQIDAALGPCSAKSAQRSLSSTSSQPATCSLNPGKIFFDVRGVDDDTHMGARQTIDQAIVDDATVGAADWRVERLAIGKPEHVVATNRLACSMAFSPSNSNSPIWLTSKSPAASRTLRCSSTIPLYCRGIANPAKSTILPPASRCRSNRGVFLVSGAWEVLISCTAAFVERRGAVPARAIASINQRQMRSSERGRSCAWRSPVVVRRWLTRGG